jgi:flavin-dependent dehydrogenase
VCAGADWVAVGDAARTVDPLSGQGVTEACRSAIQAAEALADRGDASALRALSAGNAAAHRRDVVTGLGHYRRETRWPRSPFWVRRHQRFRAMSRYASTHRMIDPPGRTPDPRTAPHY